MKRRRRFRYQHEPEFDALGRRVRLRHPPELLERLAGEQNWRCCHCGVETMRRCTMKKRFIMSTLEHIVPFSIGGADDESNLAMACDDCNASRGNQSLEEFYRGRGFENGT